MGSIIPLTQLTKWAAENKCKVRIDTQCEDRHELAKKLAKHCNGRRNNCMAYDCPIGLLLCPLGFPFAPCLPENDTEITPEMWLVHIKER